MNTFYRRRLRWRMERLIHNGRNEGIRIVSVTSERSGQIAAWRYRRIPASSSSRLCIRNPANRFLRLKSSRDRLDSRHATRKKAVVFLRTLTRRFPYSRSDRFLLDYLHPVLAIRTKLRKPEILMLVLADFPIFTSAKRRSTVTTRRYARPSKWATD
jgi:hypothetical protein